jgi:hypothetical protein
MYRVYHIEGKERTVLVNSDDIELIGGMVVGGASIYSDLFKDRKGEVTLDTNTDLSSFRVVSALPIDKIKQVDLSTILGPLEYGVWMKSSIPYRYDLFRYKTTQFVRGILLMCKHYEEDIRDYIYRFPVDYLGREYDIQGYHVKSLIISQDSPDLDDMEEENKDNENIMEPFAREDD